jgi:hypothetical protein
MAALLGCQMLSGFFSRYELGKEAIRTWEGLPLPRQGKVASRPFPGVPLISATLS